MKRSDSANLSLWFSLPALLLSIIAIVLIVFGPEDITFNHDSYISICVTVLSILVTVIVAWQIYNVIEIKEKLNTIDSLESRLEYQAHELEQKYNNACHHQDYIAAQISADREDYIDSYRWLINSLHYSSLLDRPKNTERIIEDMALCVENINKNYQINKILWEEIESSHETIINSPIFDSFRTPYMHIYNDFKSKVKLME